MADVGSQAVDGQDNPALRGKQALQATAVGQGDGQQFIVAVQQVGDGAFRDGQAAGHEVLVDFGDGAVLGIAEGADVGQDVQAELVLRQRVAALGLGTIGLQIARALPLVAAADVQDEAGQAPERGDSAAVTVVGPHALPAGGAVLVQNGQLVSEGGLGTGDLP